MILNLRTLTPMHVGDGSQLHAFDYTIHDGKFYRTSQFFFERFLVKIGGDSAERFASWSADILDELEDLEAHKRRDPRSGRDFNQKMSDLRKQFTLREFAKKIGQEKTFLDFIREQNLHGLPMQPVAKGEKEKQEIRGFLRAVDGAPYLPGSTVKGSIRTALMYHFLQHHAAQDTVRDILKKSLDQVRFAKAEASKKGGRFNTTRVSKSFAEELEHLTFYAGMVNERGKRSDKEAQDDLMRCVLVADTLLPKETLCIENIDLYLVKKLQKGLGFEAQRQRQAPAVEAIVPNTNVAVKLDFNVELLLHLHRQSGEAGIAVGREKHFIGWRSKARWLFDLSDADFNSVPPNAKADDPAVLRLKEKALAHIINCCRQFTAAQAEALQNWKENFKKHDAGGMSRALDAGVSSVLQATGARLHLGFATGFEGMTTVLHLLAKHKPLFADIMDVFGIGDSPTAYKTRRPGETYRSNPDKFPASRRLATRAGIILPLGWLEWSDDPLAGAPVVLADDFSDTIVANVPAAKVEPQYLRGTLKVGARLDGELISAGNPGRFKLFIKPDNEPIVEVKYPAGFKESDVSRIASLLVKNIKGGTVVDRCDFERFK